LSGDFGKLWKRCGDETRVVGVLSSAVARVGVGSWLLAKEAVKLGSEL